MVINPFHSILPFTHITSTSICPMLRPDPFCGAFGYRLIRFTIPAGETIFTEFNVMLNQVYLLDIAVRILGFGSIYCPVDQSVGCFTLSMASYDRKNIHYGLLIVMYFYVPSEPHVSYRLSSALQASST